jgi:hypothetical protein
VDDEYQPLLCARKGCNKVVRFSNTDLCEDCWATNTTRFHGKDQSADIPFRLREDSTVEWVNKFTPRQHP